MKRILLAFSSELIGREVQQMLSESFDAIAVRDTDEIFILLRDFQPDVFVLDLMVSGMDSGSILRAARDNNPSCRILAAVSYISDYASSIIEDTKVDYLLKLPSRADHIAGRIADLALWERDGQDMIRVIRNTLICLGFKINTEGYRITELAVRLFWEEPGQSLSQKLYPNIAVQIGGTPTQVEKAIRSCVERAWKTGDENIWRLYFSTGKHGKIVKPTNKEFFAKLANCLENDQKAKEYRQGRSVS